MKKSILIALFAAMPLFAQEAAPEAAAPAPAPEAAAAPEAGQPGCGCRRHHGQRPELTEEQKAEFRARMLEKFDTNKDGQLDEQEKEAMRAAHRAHRGEGRCGKGPRPEGKPGCCPKGPRPEGRCGKGPRPEGKPGCCPKGPRPECKPAPEAAPAEAPAPAPEA